MHRRVRTVLAVCAGTLLATLGALPAQQVTAVDRPAPDSAPARSAEVFQQVTLAKGEAETGEPMSLAVLPDRSVLHTSRDGTVRLTDATGTTRVAGRIPVYTHDEEGLQGVGVDPGFTENRFVYLYYAPPLDTPAGDAPDQGTDADFARFDGVNRLSRFVLDRNGTLDTASERQILDVPASRGTCCHVGGDIDFDAAGNLYLSTGDDTNPFASDGYSPIDDRAGRNPAYDARRSAGNTNDLRGKVLRIKVNEDGSYGVPDGNLFAPGTERTRPEIYAMGLRNPYRISVDRPTGVLYVGEYGPDAGTADPARGPAGQVEFDRITEAGNYGWPYCTGENDAYVDHDFGTGTPGETFDCDAPKNTSRYNTGLTDLPPAQPAWITYDGASVPEFGDGSESPMGGPVYRYDPDLDSPVKFPESYDGDYFATEFGRQWIKRIDQDENGTVAAIHDVPWSGTQVMDSAFGPDGALYVLDYGLGWFGGDENSALYRIENATGGFSPTAEAFADRTSGQGPLTVAFTSTATDPDTDQAELTHTWDFGDGATATGPEATHTYTTDGQYSATLTVHDPTQRVGSASVRITVGNTAPTVQIRLPADGRPFTFGDSVPFRVTVTDPEEPQIDCSRVVVRYVLGHDRHGHQLTSTTGCTGALQTTADSEHDPNANVFGIVDVEYTDRGANGQPALTTHDDRLLQPRQRQAEHFTATEGTTVVSHSTARGGKAVGDIHDGDWIAFSPYYLRDVTALTARVASAGSGGTLEVRSGAPDGRLLGRVAVPVTGGWEQYRDVTTALEPGPPRTTELYLVFRGGDGALFDVDDFTLTTR